MKIPRLPLALHFVLVLVVAFALGLVAAAALAQTPFGAPPHSNGAAAIQLVFPIVLSIGTALLAPWLHKHVKTQSDAARATTIAHVANDVAAAVYANNPNLRWLDLVKQATQQIEDSVPTSSTDVIERAAIAALFRAGAKPDPAAVSGR